MAEPMSFKESTIAFPFKIDSSGSVASITDSRAIYAAKVRAVIGTLITQRVMRPRFGCRLNEVVWNNEVFIRKNVNEFVAQAFNVWLPMLYFTNATVSTVSNTGEINIEIFYELPNREETSAIIGIIGLNGDKLSSQEIR